MDGMLRKRKIVLMVSDGTCWYVDESDEMFCHAWLAMRGFGVVDRRIEELELAPPKPAGRVTGEEPLRHRKHA